MSEAQPLNPYEPSREPVRATSAPAGSGLVRDGDTLSIEFETTAQDYGEEEKENTLASWMAVVRPAFLPTLVAVFVGPHLYRQIRDSLNSGWNLRFYIWAQVIILALAVVYWGLYPIWARWRNRSPEEMVPDGQNDSVGLWRIIISPERFTALAPLGEHYLQWKSVRGVGRTSAAVIVYIGRTSWFSVPLRAFANPAEIDEFEQAILARMTP